MTHILMHTFTHAYTKLDNIQYIRFSEDELRRTQKPWGDYFTHNNDEKWFKNCGRLKRTQLFSSTPFYCFSITNIIDRINKVENKPLTASSLRTNGDHNKCQSLASCGYKATFSSVKISQPYSDDCQF